MDIHKAYDGREHSVIKHALLQGYLEKLLFIKGMTGTREIAYVDCFSGPYKDESSDIPATSIAISLNILDKVRSALMSQGKSILIRAIYVEKSKARYARLKEYIESHCPSGIQAFSICGDYAEKSDEILRRCGDNSFAFFFVDPLGWIDVGISRLSRLLEREKSEFLITFMYDFLNRFVGKADLRGQVTDMLGPLTDDEYQQIAHLSPKDREDFIVRRYRQQIMKKMAKQGGALPRSYHAVIKDKDKERTKYHLVYGTRHHQGIIEFAGQSEKVDFIQRVVRIQAKMNSTIQTQLFSAEAEAECVDGARIEFQEVKNYWLNELSSQPTVFDNAKLADMLEETGWFIGDFQRAFKELLAEKRVENLDGNPRRSKNPIHFDKGERLRKHE